MAAVNGSLARKLEFGDEAISVGAAPRLRLAPASQGLRGPDKYKALAHRRHQAQIKARRLLELADEVVGRDEQPLVGRSLDSQNADPATFRAW